MSPRSHAALERAISQPFGAVVVVGPTGSGKTTTLFTCLQLLNTPDRQLTTIEDPVEYRVDGLDQVEVNPRAGLTFANGLRTMLRSDPDVLLVGEIRDEETAQIAFRAAMTGHLILTTLHAQTAASAIQRLTDMNIERSILATSINCIVGQRLARRVCQCCCEPTTPDPSCSRPCNVLEMPTASAFVQAVGCQRVRRHRLPRSRAAVRGDDDDGRDRAARRRADAGDRGDGGLAGHVRRSARTACASRRPGITTLEEVRRVAGDDGDLSSRHTGAPPALYARARMTLVELDDAPRSPPSCGATRGAHVYELGDLDDFDWPLHALVRRGSADGRLEQVVLLYTRAVRARS